jgi:23S rRNA U2552 (ribose-2'-O)-methylase RlmE/FtsJ/DNA-directed RNA polymerase subunit E'/Rpb7
MNHLYVPQIIKVKVILDPVDMCKDYEQKIKEKLGNRCYMDGFIIKSTISIIKIENGKREGSHLHGFLTFHVEFSALFCVPKRDVIIPCRIKKINKFGVMAESFPIPMDIIVPRQLQAYSDIDKLKDLYEGEYISVKITDYTMESNKLVVVGVITEAGLPKPNTIELPLDGLVSYDVSQIVGESSYDRTMPAPNPIYGSNDALNELKDKITPFCKIMYNNRSLWQSEIKKKINPYELVDEYRGHDLIKYNYTSIYDEQSIYRVITRAYFKLWEVLSDTHILDQYVNQPINIANLAEGPGGFIQCVLDFRNRQHKSEWKQDTYHAITIKQNVNIASLKSVQDWDNYPKGKTYFEKVNSEGYKVNLSYGQTGDGNMLNIDNIRHFSDQIGDNKCQLITSDGGIFLSDEEYGTQELNNAKLFFSEIITAIANQAPGGAFVLKIYDIYYDVTVQLLHLLGMYYDKLALIKPRTSRPANSEKYVVCTGFKTIPADQLDEQIKVLMDKLHQWITNETATKKKKYMSNLFPLIQKDQSSFVDNIVQFNKYNVELQMVKINEGLEIAMYEKYKDRAFMTKYDDNQREIGKEWCESYNIPHM